MALKDAPTSVLLENVLSLIHQKLPKNSASLVECFVAKFYGNMASTDLHELIRRVVVLLTPQAEQKGVRFTLQLQAAQPELACDGEQMMQVLLNLVLTGSFVVAGYLFSRHVIGLFITDPAVVDLAQTLLHIMLWSSVIMGMSMVLSGLMRASGTVRAGGGAPNRLLAMR